MFGPLSFTWFVLRLVLSALVFTFLSLSVSAVTLVWAISSLLSWLSLTSGLFSSFCSLLGCFFSWLLGNRSIFLLNNGLTHLGSFLSSRLKLSFFYSWLSYGFGLSRLNLLLLDLNWLFFKDFIDNLFLVNRFVFDFIVTVLFDVGGKCFLQFVIISELFEPSGDSGGGLIDGSVMSVGLLDSSPESVEFLVFGGV